jgi:hypothetical protein
MKTNLTFFGSSIAICVAMIACENMDQNLMPDFVNLKIADNGRIKSYNNPIFPKWEGELSLAVDNKMPPASESRIYAMVTVAMHDTLNNVVPVYEIYAPDNSGADTREVSKKNISLFADAAAAEAAHVVLVVLAPGSAESANSLLTECLAQIEESDFKSRGIQTGKDAASTR